MANDRLRAQMDAAKFDVVDLAAAIQVDPKTVERWIQRGRLPHRRHRVQTAELLAAEETYLWPELLQDERVLAASQAEVVSIYTHRGAVPPDLWRRLAGEATQRVDVLVYAGLFLLDSDPDLPAKLTARAQEGLQGRLLYGSPSSTTVAARGEEEGIGDYLAARIGLSLNYMAPVLATPGIEVRLHESVLYNSIYRFDDEMLVNTHVAGSPAPQNPVIHLHRVEGGHLFDHYLRSFDRVWDSATPFERPGEQESFSA